MGSGSPASPPVGLQRPAPALERAAVVSRDLGCARRAGESAADGASWCPRVQPGPLPASQAVSRGAADPASMAAAAPIPICLQSGDTKAPVEPASPHLCLCGFGSLPRWRPCWGMGDRGNGKPLPLSFLVRPSCKPASIKEREWPAPEWDQNGSGEKKWVSLGPLPPP